MADEVEDEVELDLELDVSFNEFEDEVPLETTADKQIVSKKDCIDANKAKCGGNSSRHVASTTLTRELSNKPNTLKTFKNVQSTALKCSELDDEEGELLKSDEEFDLDTTHETHRPQNSISEDKTDNGAVVRENSLKRTFKSSLEEEIAMEIDEDGLLDSDDEAPSLTEERKKMKLEECKSFTGNEDQVMKAKRRSSRKKKDRKLKYSSQKLHEERKIRPVIGRLFRPLTATEDDSDEFLANQLAERLSENKVNLILRVVKILGATKAIEMFKETKRIQMEGGMMTADQYRRRTSGGIFLYTMKAKGYATKSQIKEIYAEEREKEKQLLKEQKQREKELEEKELHDLRELLAKKREMLVEMENENKIET